MPSLDTVMASENLFYLKEPGFEPLQISGPATSYGSGMQYLEDCSPSDGSSYGSGMLHLENCSPSDGSSYVFVSAPSRSSNESTDFDMEAMSESLPGDTKYFPEYEEYHPMFHSCEPTEQLANNTDASQFHVAIIGNSLDFSPVGNSYFVGSGYLSSHHAGNDDPWNGVTELRQPHYSTGFVAYFHPSPEVSGESFGETNCRQDDAFDSLTTGLEPFVSNSDALLIPLSSDTHPCTWIHEFGYSGKECSTQRGRRSGPMHPERRKQALEMRRIKACLTCYIRKVKCSPGIICSRCSKYPTSLSPLAGRLSCRSGLGEYAPLFFPDVLTSHLAQEEVEILITANVRRFRDGSFPIEVSTGNFAPLRLQVHTFEPEGRHLCFQEGQYSAPVGLFGICSRDLENDCEEYIESMLRCRSYPEEVTLGEKSSIRREVLRLVFNYNQQENNDEVHVVMKLHAMHYCMKKLVTFTPQSAALLLRGEGIASENVPYLSSKLLNRQIKAAIHHLLKGAQKASLKNFEKEVRKRSRDAWPIAFSVLLILCLCAEDIQIAADTFITHPQDGDDFHRDDSHKISLDLETLQHEQCTNVFHEVYATHKPLNGHGGSGSFNPVKQGQLSGSELSAPAQELVSRIRDLIINHYDEISEFSVHQTFDKDGFHSDNARFIEQNPGRLVSKFLMSFMKP